MIGQPSTNPRAPHDAGAATRPGAVRRFVSGIVCLGRGFRVWGTSPRLMLLGALPAILVGTVYAAAMVVLVLNLGSVAGGITPFADGFVQPWRNMVRIAAGTAVLVAAVLVAVFTFAALTLAVGDPFYEKIWHDVERRAGGVPPERNESFARQARRGIGNGLRLLTVTLLLGAVLFVGGFIPVLGQSAVPVLGVAFGGWILAVELTGFAFDARGFTLGQRRQMLAGNRAGTLGFGIATYLLFLVPFAAVVTMPAAVAGATMLARTELHRNPPKPVQSRS
jgi:CysZ protein